MAKRDDLKTIDDLSQIRAREVRERMRGRFAVVFLALFALLVLSSILLWSISLAIPLRGSVAEIKDMVLTMSALFSGPLGLMIGYYFRAEIEGRITL